MVEQQDQSKQSAAAQQAGATVVNVIQERKDGNGLGIGGFVLALIALFVSWVPVLGWIIWILGAILSLVGLRKQPRGLAIAGTIISFIDFILLALVISACSAGVSMM
ncbi:hypothetical protein B5F40_13550 [Gordonibacter sp. An230]|uniref:hypothetical protein n=1 Tax=Gordonibacter sp. An230 TaxID=1965592 RepID=UPI000B38254E|nr:hypothetical protein [Gordonibacter sp. An230]OUO87556.1 hypothetical protein B5F40_13550 [Gordonibacter sp. An230]